jgi:hypothetical protein
MAYHLTRFMTQAQISSLNRAVGASTAICATVFLAMIVLGLF